MLSSPLPMLSPPTIFEPTLGLKIVADIALANPITPNCVVRNYIVSAPTSSNNGIIDVEEEKEEEEESAENACWGTYGKKRHSRCRFPPRIPLLARTGNLSCHMPWVLKRIYKDDGSLVIQEVRAEHHDYFRARRENGRLMLQLIELDQRSLMFNSDSQYQAE